MANKLSEIEGIGETYAAKLAEQGLKTTDDLLQAGETPLKREKLAAATGISDKLILKWCNHADLFRIKGVAGEFAELLEAAGVDTVVELSKRVPANLHAKLAEVNEEKKLVRRTPHINEVTEWVEQAKQLPRMLKY